MTRETIRVSLCGGEKCCPEVAVDVQRGQVRIGEEGNLVILDKRAWNTLVEKIKHRELSALE